MEFNSKEELILSLQNGRTGRKFDCDGLEVERALNHVIQNLDRTPGAEEQLLGVIVTPDVSQIRLLNNDRYFLQAYEYAQRKGGRLTLYGVSAEVFKAARNYYTPTQP